MALFRSMVRYTGSALILAGLGVFGYQAYTWYNIQHWFQMDLLWAVQWLAANPILQHHLPTLVDWFHTPRRWLAFHQLLLFVLDLVPFSLFLVVSGGFLFAVVYRGENQRSQAIATVESEMRARVGDKYAEK